MQINSMKELSCENLFDSYINQKHIIRKWSSLWLGKLPANCRRNIPEFISLQHARVFKFVKYIKDIDNWLTVKLQFLFKRVLNIFLFFCNQLSIVSILMLKTEIIYQKMRRNKNFITFIHHKLRKVNNALVSRISPH